MLLWAPVRWRLYASKVRARKGDFAFISGVVSLVDQEFNDLENEMASKENAAMIKTPQLKIGIVIHTAMEYFYGRNLILSWSFYRVFNPIYVHWRNILCSCNGGVLFVHSDNAHFWLQNKARKGQN